MTSPGVIRFAELARRLGSAARAAGLIVPAFRSPPRLNGARRTIRRLPGGPVIAVQLRSRLSAEVVSDMIEGIVVANNLEGDAAARVRTALAAALVSVDQRPGWRNRQTQVA